MGVDVVQIVVVEPVVDFCEQLGCGAQVNLSGTDIYVPQVGGQRREPGVDLLPVPVPGQQSVNGEGMDARAGVLVVNDAALLEELAKSAMDYAVAQATPLQINEQGGVW